MFDVKTAQFITDEVKPMVRKTIPELLKRIEALEKDVHSLNKLPEANPFVYGGAKSPKSKKVKAKE